MAPLRLALDPHALLVSAEVQLQARAAASMRPHNAGASWYRRPPPQLVYF